MNTGAFVRGGVSRGRRVVLALVVLAVVLAPVSGGVSAVSGDASPVAPSGVSAASTDVSVTVSWVVPAQPGVYLDDMFLERVEDDGNGVDVAVLSKDVADDWDLSEESSWSERVDHLEAGTEYRFRVRLATTGHDDVFSETVTVSTQSEPPAAPEGLSASVGEDGRVSLSWTVPAQPDWVDDLEELVVDRRDSGGEAHFGQVADVDWERGVTAYSAVDESPRRGLALWYRVKMVAGGRWIYGDELEVTVPAQVASGAGPLAGFSLIDASSQLLRAVVADGDTVELAGAASGDFTIRADIADGPTVGSVHFELAGPVSATRTESFLPYVLYGDNGSDDLFGGGPLPAGEYTLSATAYGMRYRRGDVLGALDIAFTIADPDPAAAPQLADPAGPLAGFSLIDASDQTVIAALGADSADESAVALADPDGGSYAIRADIADGESVGSVSLTLSGAASYGPSTENSAPYSLHGDNTNPLDPQLWGRPLPAGDYTLTATAYHGRGLTGARTGTLQAAFTVTEGGPSGYPDFSLDAFNEEPNGMWSDGTTMWVVEWNTNQVFAYSLSDGSRDSGSDITLHSGHTAPSGIWSDGTTVWVGDREDEKLYAYALADGSRDSASDRSLETGLKPDGFWSNGTTMWIVDGFDERVYAYSASDWSRDSANDFTLFSDHLLAVHNDVWSDGTTMWVAEWTEGKLHAYTLSDLTRHPGLSVDTSRDLGVGDPGGVWSNGTTMWVIDNENLRVRVIDKPAIGQPGRPASGPLAGFSLVNAANQRLMARLTDGASVGVGDPDGGSYAIRADVVRGGVVGSMSLELSGAKDVPARTESTGPYSLYGDRKNRWFRDLNGGTLPVGDYTLAATVYSQPGLRGTVHGTLEVSFSVTLDEDGDYYGEGPPPTYSGFELANFNRDPMGIWSNGTTMWVLDIYDEYVYAYSLADGSRTRNWDLDLHSGHTTPRGIWSDGTTMWVGDQEDEKLYAYSLADGSRDIAADRPLATGQKPDGLWSDGTTMWIVDGYADRAHAYQMSGWHRDSANDIELTGEHLLAQHNDVWSDGTTLWVAEWVEPKLYAYTLADQSRNPRLDIDVSLEFGIDDPTGVWSNGTTMWILDGDDEEVHVIGRNTAAAEGTTGELADAVLQLTRATVGATAAAFGADAGAGGFKRGWAKAAESTPTNSIVYVVDDSGSMDFGFPEVRTALEAVRDESMPNTKVALIAFGTIPTTFFGLQDHATAPWDDYIDQFSGRRGKTSFGLALGRARGMLAADSASVKKIIFLTDGQGSLQSRDSFLETLADAGIVLDSIAFGVELSYFGEVQKLATDSGGTYIGVKKPSSATANDPVVTATAIADIFTGAVAENTATLFVIDETRSMAGPDRSLGDGPLESALAAAATKAGTTTGAQIGMAQFMGYGRANNDFSPNDLEGAFVVKYAIGSSPSKYYVARFGGGSSNVEHALKEAFSTVSGASPANKRVVLVTDGITEDAVTAETLDKYNNDSSVTLDVVAWGDHADRAAMKGWADDAGGNYYVAG